MRVPRVRFTVRLMMLVVAVVAACSAIVHWAALSRRYERAGSTHAFLSVMSLPMAMSDVDVYSRRAAYHERLREKYYRAARFPWLPVAPDPPEPE